MTTIQKTLLAVILVAAVGAGTHLTRNASTLRSQMESLQQQIAPLTDQNEQLIRERDEAIHQIAALRQENERLNRNSGELLRLRGQVGLLRQQTNELAQNSQPTPPETIQPKKYYPKESLKFVGYDDPDLALESFLWAMSRRDLATLLNSFTPDARTNLEEIIQDKPKQTLVTSDVAVVTKDLSVRGTESSPIPIYASADPLEEQIKLLAKGGDEMSQIKGFQVLDKKFRSGGDKVRISFSPIYFDGRDAKTLKINLKRVENKWEAY